MFIFGGLTGLVNASYSLNLAVHNTGWISGHFHMTVAGPVFLAVIGLNLYIYSKVAGKEIKFRPLATIVPYVWMIGVVPLSHGLMAGGLMGEPRRTNLGMTYTNPNSPLFNKHWVLTTSWTLVGGIILGVAVLLYFISFFSTVFSKRTATPQIVLPEAEELHEERRLPYLMNMRPWIIASVVLTIVSYIPSFVNINKYSQPTKSKYQVESPENLAK